MKAIHTKQVYLSTSSNRKEKQMKRTKNMKRILILSTCIIAFGACKKKSNDPTPSGVVGTSEIGVISFSVNGKWKHCNAFSNALYTESIARGSYSLAITGMTDLVNIDANEAVAIKLPIVSISKGKSTILNYVSSEQNTLSYSYGDKKKDEFNNTACDKLFSGGSNHFGDLGFFEIESIDYINKTITGSFSMELCSLDKRNVKIQGKFTHLPYKAN